MRRGIKILYYASKDKNIRLKKFVNKEGENNDKENCIYICFFDASYICTIDDTIIYSTF